jgi:hypothetical protein
MQIQANPLPTQPTFALNLPGYQSPSHSLSLPPPPRRLPCTLPLTASVPPTSHPSGCRLSLSLSSLKAECNTVQDKRVE